MVDSQNPEYVIVKLKGSDGYFVLVSWPDGFETQVHGFASETDARTWTSVHEPRWQEWAPQRVRRTQ